MKYRHYAPEAKCKLVNCLNELDQIFILKRLIAEYDENIVLIGFEEHKEKLFLTDDKFISLGSRNNLEEVAKNIYSALRKADKKKPALILIEGVPKKGLGIAIMNRLLRTCEYDCIE